MKIHYFDLEEHLKVPSHLRENSSMAACGYLREKTTESKEEVTCKLCLREMKKIQLGK